MGRRPFEVSAIVLPHEVAITMSWAPPVFLSGAEGCMRRNRVTNRIAGQGLPFQTLCIESCLTSVVVVNGGLAVGHGVCERDACDLERLQECRCRVAEHLVS